MEFIDLRWLQYFSSFKKKKIRFFFSLKDIFSFTYTQSLSQISKYLAFWKKIFLDRLYIVVNQLLIWQKTIWSKQELNL